MIKHPTAKSLNLSFVVMVLVFSTINCKKQVTENLLESITTLDCRNLIIRNVTLKNSKIEVALENTCKSCDDNWVYLGMTMTDRQNQADTLAQTSCLSCLSSPKNGETLTYQLNTNLTSLPDLKSVRFDFGYLCKDVTYLRK
jgi:hypothetical protein